MTAILCRICCIEPCRQLSKCCVGFCECFGDCCGSICNCVTGCCDVIGNFCYKPFSCCLFFSLSLNAIALIYGVFAIVEGGDQCGNPLLILLILEFVCAVINAIFSYYLYHTINNDPNNPLFNNHANNTARSKGNANANEMSTAAKMCEFCKYDKWFAVYIIFLAVMLAITITALAMSGGCMHSVLGRGVFWTSVILFIYLGVGLLFLSSYVMVEALKEMSQNCCWWTLPCCWPLLCIGCCLRWSDTKEAEYEARYPDRQRYPAQQQRNNNARSDYPAAQPQQRQQQAQQRQKPQTAVRVQAQTQQRTYQQPPPQQQHVVSVRVVQPFQPQQQHPQQQRTLMVAKNPSELQGQPQGQGGYGAVKPGVFVPHQQQQPQQVQYAQPPPQQTNSGGGSPQPGDQSQNVVQYDADGKASINKSNLKRVAADTAKEKGSQALGWAARKMNAINEKVQDKYGKDGEGNGAAAPAEGQGY